MENNSKIQFPLVVCALLIMLSCESQQKQFTSPPGYDLSKPERYNMPVALREISGIAFNKGMRDTIYAEQDEDGKVFHFKLGDDRMQSTRFGKKGDYEDISICNNYIIMLRSDGVLYTFPLSETSRLETDQVKLFEGLLPSGEYEGLASIDSSGKVYVLCKRCDGEKTRKWGGGSIFQMNSAGNLIPCGNFEINIKEIDAAMGTSKIKFHPSALDQNPATGEWYVLSATNRMLVITDKEWKVKAVHALNPSIFPQPEGITFDRDQNLYISNERAQTQYGTILVFKYKPH